VSGTITTRDGQRIIPVGPAGAYKTFGFSQLSDRMDVISCYLAQCEHWEKGWETTVDERTDLGVMQATYIRQKSGRTYKEMKSGSLTVFRFSRQQRCFGEHRTRPQNFFERGGDWRKQTGGLIRHTRESWVGTFEEHQGRQAEERQRG
jgi:hypothetical protein